VMGRLRAGTTWSIGDLPLLGSTTINLSGEYSGISYRFNGESQQSYRYGGSIGFEFTP
jgi:hypothetical protein